MINPLVSLLMTSFNREKYIAEAIEGVLSSTYKNFELIIVDDCSTDNTCSIARVYQNRDNRIKLFINEKNLGQFYNRNKCVEYANGEYLIYADSDDILFSNGIEECVNAMINFPNSSFGMFWPSAKGQPFLIKSTDAIRQHFFVKPFLTIGPGGTIVRRSFFNEIGKYPTDFGVSGDMYFNLKATCFSPVVMLPFEFVFYRRHQGQEINNNYSYLINNYRYLRDALNELPLQLKHNEVEWLKKKNKRRFFTNICKFYLTTFDLIKTIDAVNMAEFTFNDAIQGVFH